MTTSQHHNSSPAFYAEQEARDYFYTRQREANEDYDTDREFGKGWENEAAEPDFRVNIPEFEVDENSVERVWLETMRDFDQFEGFGS